MLACKRAIGPAAVRGKRCQVENPESLQNAEVGGELLHGVPSQDAGVVRLVVWMRACFSFPWDDAIG